MNIKPRPWWLFFLGRDYWVTISPNVYHPKGVNPGLWPAIIEHETAHIWQQARYGLLRFLWRYIWSRQFRYDMEIEACRAELQALPIDQRSRAAHLNAYALSTGYTGLDFKNAATSYSRAYDDITRGLL